MNTALIFIETLLDYRIAVSVFKPKKPKGIVVISSATGVKQSYYSNFALFLQKNGFVVYTYDYNGIGKSNSENIKQIKSSAYDWGSNDLNSVLKYAIKNNLNLPLTVIGHSIGGQLIGLAPTSVKIKTLILVASQSGYWKLWKGVEKIKMILFWYIILPFLTKIVGYFPAKKLGIMENLPKNMAKEWGGWAKKENYLFDVINKKQLYYHKIKANLISYSTDYDKFAPEIAVDWLTKKYANATIIRKHLRPDVLNVSKIGHFGFFKSKFKDTIWPMFLHDINQCFVK